MRAVDGVDLSVPAGTVFGAAVADGAGKSTLSGCWPPCSPRTPKDARINGFPGHRAGRAGDPRIGYMSQRFSLYADLTVAENIEFFATLRGVPRDLRRSRATELLTGMGLDQVPRPAGSASCREA